MSRGRLHISAGALLLLALLLYLSRPEEALALLLPVLCHELGHVLMLWLLGLRLQGFRLELKGFCIDYSGCTGALGHAAAAAAGPLAGLSYALAAARLAERLGLDWLCLSAGLSLLLSLFNLLPALPLDGGRIFCALSCAILGERRGGRLTDALGLAVGVLLLFGGIALLLRGRGAALLLAAVWLLAYQEQGRGIVKKREVL